LGVVFVRLLETTRAFAPAVLRRWFAARRFEGDDDVDRGGMANGHAQKL
jgi:hypothetical protein